MSKITVDFNPKNMRLIMKSPIYLVDIMRSFPSRRFEPKSKNWLMPLTKQNAAHLSGLRGVDVEVLPAARTALDDLERLTAPPVYTPIPRDWFEKTRHSPLEHQWPMLDRGWSLRGYALFAAMGTGKTFVTVNMALARHRYCGLQFLLVVCPSTLHRTWEREFAKYGNEDLFTTRRLKTADSGLLEWMKSSPKKLHVLLVGVEGLGISDKYFDKAMSAVRVAGKTMAVCDESSRIKNPKAVRTERAISLAESAEWRMILNGTPIAKGIQDLWSQYQFLDPNIIGSGDYFAFKSRYVVMGGYEMRQIVGYANTDELMNMITPYSLEVNKNILKLPPKIYKTIHVEPTTAQRQLFTKIRTGLGDGPNISVKNVLERMLRLQQVIGGFEPRTDPETEETTLVPLADNPKLNSLMQVVEDNYAGSKFIIWARYVPELELIVRSLRKEYGNDAVVTYYGDTSPEDRATAENRYCNDPTCRFIVGNPAAAGLGLTFISGESDVMVYYSGTFAYIDRAQSEDRAHRIGQTNSCPIIDFVMEDSIDETIIEAIAAKMDMDVFFELCYVHIYFYLRVSKIFSLSLTAFFK